MTTQVNQLHTGDRVRVYTSHDPLQGTFTERFTFGDGTPGAWVTLDDGTVCVAPLSDICSELITV